MTSRFRADLLKMPCDSSATSGNFINKQLHGGGRGGWEEVRSLWRNSAYEVGFCCKQKKKREFCSKKEKSNSSNLGRKTRESVATLGNFSHLSTIETYS